jgi:hypothetical protein
MDNVSYSQEKVQLEFEPSSLDSKPISVSDNPFTFSGFPKEVLSKIADLIGIKMGRNLMCTCKSLRDFLQPWFLQALASETYPDRATSKFIADAIGNNVDACLWLNAKFYRWNLWIPKGLSIHLFTNTITKKISSSEVRSMIIQVSKPFDSYSDSCEFLNLLFSKVSFTNLKCLMLSGFRFWHKFPKWLKKLNLEVFHMAKFSLEVSVKQCRFSCDFDILERLYVVNHYSKADVILSRPLKELVVYCPESDLPANCRWKLFPGLVISLESLHTHEEM